MQITIPPDLEAVVQKRIDTGAFSSPEDVIRHALETQDFDETWTEEDRKALDEKIDLSIADFAEGRFVGPEELQRRLAALAEARLTSPTR